MTINEAYESLCDYFEPRPNYLQVVGNGSNVLYVYLTRKRLNSEKPIPEKWGGFDVITKIIGKMRPLGGNNDSE